MEPDLRQNCIHSVSDARIRKKMTSLEMVKPIAVWKTKPFQQLRTALKWMNRGALDRAKNHKRQRRKRQWRLTFGVFDFSRWAVTDWCLRRWRLCFLALKTATRWIHFQRGGPLSHLLALQHVSQCFYAHRKAGLVVFHLLIQASVVAPMCTKGLVANTLPPKKFNHEIWVTALLTSLANLKGTSGISSFFLPWTFPDIIVVWSKAHEQSRT